MKIEDVERLFPDRTFGLFKIERGPTGDRKLVWIAQWYVGYFTSDSDRHIFHGTAESAEGATPEEALDRLVIAELEKARLKTEGARDRWREAVSEERSLAIRIEEAKVR